MSNLRRQVGSLLSAKPPKWAPWLVWLAGWVILAQVAYATLVAIAPPVSIDDFQRPEYAANFQAWRLEFFGQLAGGIAFVFSGIVAIGFAQGGASSAWRFLAALFAFVVAFYLAANLLGWIPEALAPIGALKRSVQLQLLAAIVFAVGTIDCLSRLRNQAPRVSMPRVVSWALAVAVLVAFSLTPSGYYQRTGAICEDGTYSSATGSGACSWHGGVQEWLQQFIPTND